MSSLSETIRRLSALGQPTLPATYQGKPGGVLKALDDFGSNPGQLDALAFVPADLSPRSPLVVVLHGCTQTAEAYEQAAGWTKLASRHGFAVLYPQQRRSNNANLCFNWFETADMAHRGGEAESIAQMVDHMTAVHRLDKRRIYVTGLSAGGAMTSIMLARYPDIFAGGAIIAGLPFGVASSVPQALDRMRGKGLPDARSLSSLVRDASSHGGDWPRLSIWQGDADHVVVPANADAIIDQWLPLHGLDRGDAVMTMVDGHARRAWRDADGRHLMEHHSIPGLGHGTPISSKGVDALGKPGPHMLEAGTSSTRHIAHFWGLAPAVATTVSSGDPEQFHQAKAQPAAMTDVLSVIDAALRSAGIKR